MAESTSRGTPIRISALGGLGEIGLNLMVLECAGSAIVIDCGVMFPDEPALGGGLYVPEFGYLEKRHIDGVVLTHAHEDHIGAIWHLLRRINVPVFGTELTLAFVRRRLESETSAADGIRADLRPMFPRRPFRLGAFEVEPIRVTHSTPDSVALAIRTPAGIIVHSGDFKIDPAPVDGEQFDRERFAQLGAEGVELLLSDSTNVERPGRSGSESSIKPVLHDIVAHTRGRFILTAFSSHLHRIRQATEVAREFGRRVVPLGRRVAESVRLGIETGQLNFPPGTFIDAAEADFLERRKLAYLASGSQGEPESALARIASGNHPRFQIESGDVAVLSSRFIPGNERIVNQVVNRLYRQGAEVFYDAVAPVHVSGHGNREELEELITLLRPRRFVPIHGEYRHLARHLALARECGVPEPDCFLLEDGDSLVLESGSARRGAAVEAGRQMVDGNEVADPALIGERRVLAHDGTVTVVLVVSRGTGAIIGGPKLVSRGLLNPAESALHTRRAEQELAARLRQLNGSLSRDEYRLADELTRVVRHYFSDELGRRPLVIPQVVEV